MTNRVSLVPHLGAPFKKTYSNFTEQKTESAFLNLRNRFIGRTWTNVPFANNDTLYEYAGALLKQHLYGGRSHSFRRICRIVIRK